jgi:tetratricopeptide (TPR) repeat protein/DNA-binding XRE family transcriptional regulator
VVFFRERVDMARQHEGDPEDLRLAVIFLRSLRKWTQGKMSKASGVDRGAISAYEAGTKTPTRKTFQRLADAVGLPYSYVERLLPRFREARQALADAGSLPEPGTSESLTAGLDRGILDAVLPAVAPYVIELESLLGEETIPAAADRRVATDLWEALRKLPPGRRRLAVERERRYWSWALAERVCEESVRAAAHRADEAVELSRLALRVAELAPGSEGWRSRLLGWVWAFVANARRVQGDLPSAEEGFLRSDGLLAAGTASSPRLLDSTRPLDLKASLRRYQGRFDEALALLEQALEASGGDAARARILINRANTLELKGDFERAIAELNEAERLLQGSQDARLVLVLHHSLIRNLFQLGRYGEAEERLPEVRWRAVETGNELDLIRVLSAEGNVAAGLGRQDQAVAALEQVRRYFNANRIAYDAALASLELAVLYLEEGRTGEVKRLSEEMYWIFKAQGVHQEALAALRLFCEAATREEATADLARRLIGYLTRAQSHPGLRFEA